MIDLHPRTPWTANTLQLIAVAIHAGQLIQLQLLTLYPLSAEHVHAVAWALGLCVWMNKQQVQNSEMIRDYLVYLGNCTLLLYVCVLLVHVHKCMCVLVIVCTVYAIYVHILITVYYYCVCMCVCMMEALRWYEWPPWRYPVTQEETGFNLPVASSA